MPLPEPPRSSLGTTPVNNAKLFPWMLTLLSLNTMLQQRIEHATEHGYPTESYATTAANLQDMLMFFQMSHTAYWDDVQQRLCSLAHALPLPAAEVQ
jgi:hypothetical protein